MNVEVRTHKKLRRHGFSSNWLLNYLNKHLDDIKIMSRTEMAPGKIDTSRCKINVNV